MAPAATLNTQGLSFAPVIHLPSNYEVYDLTTTYDSSRVPDLPYGVGKYNEQRKGVYTQELFGGRRNIHMGIDIGCPVGTPVHAFYQGEVFMFGTNPAEGDYGPTLITSHILNGTRVWALYGHLSSRSLDGKKCGSPIQSGEIIGWVGDKSENGGWNPHLHFQLSLVEPDRPDLPGVVAREDLEEALKKFPDPQLVLGKLY